MLELNHLNSPQNQFRKGTAWEGWSEPTAMPSATNSERMDKTSDAGNDRSRKKRLNMAERYFEEIKQTTVLNQATDKT